MTIDLHMFTLIHVVLSVLGIILGLVVVGGLIANVRLDRWIAGFLVTTILTSLSGFGFHTDSLTPAKIVGALSLVLLAVCLVARYGRLHQGRWRAVFIVTAVASLYLNVFVLIVQLFAKTPALALLAPTQKEPPFVVTQVLIVALFVWLGRAALRSFRAIAPRRS